AARDLRYEWFEQLCSEHGYNKIAIAHNAGDANETFFINLMRSTGVEGLEGIKPRNGKIVRPLLFATRAQIESHAHQNNIEYRTDSSNLSSYYLRNWIRLEMLPKICDKQPNFSATMMSNMEHISNHNSLFSRVLQRLKSEVMIGDNVYSLSKIKLYESDSVQFLYELLKPMGFSHQNCKSIIDVTSSGRIFMSRTHRALVDRDTLIVEESGNIIDSLGTLTVECVTNCDFSALTPNKILVDGDKIVGDLSLRLYKSGDVISPLGMRGRKKVSDLLIDAKATRFEKERQKIVEDNKEIVWVVGRRASERYKVTPQTKNILLITYHTT
ncbi:MAG: tRNA lysidine(34) synthetase TilS, partial [Rikenellaceae bacterium]